MFKSALSLTLAAALGTAAFGQTTVTAVPGEAAASKYASIEPKAQTKLTDMLVAYGIE